MEEHQEENHELNEKFTGEKSTAGHMKSPLPGNSGQRKLKQSEFDIAIQSGYALRENPKKSWKFSTFDQSDDDDDNTDQTGVTVSTAITQDFVCKVCDKQFYSLKAKFGHMRHHSIKGKKRVQCSIGLHPKELQGNHTSPHPHPMVCTDSSKSNSTSASLVVDSLKGIKTLNLVRRKRSRRIRYENGASSSSAFSSLNEPGYVTNQVAQEVEDVAICLMLLSRGVHHWDELNYENANYDSLAADRNNLGSSVLDSLSCLIEQESCDLGFHIDTMLSHVCASYSDSEVPNKSRNEDKFICKTCNQVFHSYQALGGHQTLHRRNKNRSDSMELEEICVPSEIDHETESDFSIAKFRSLETSSKRKPYEKKVSTKKYKCEFCLKIFKSGQALGGHKRCHHPKSGKIACQVTDLNLPAMVDEEEEEEANGVDDE